MKQITWNKISLIIILFSILMFNVSCKSYRGGCRIIGGIPEPPGSADEITDENFVIMLGEIEKQLKSISGTNTVAAKAYYVQDSFAEIEKYFREFLGEGWESRENIVRLINEDRANVRAWSSCTDELLLIMFYENIKQDKSGLILVFAKP
jgi:hypothetical protein